MPTLMFVRLAVSDELRHTDRCTDRVALYISYYRNFFISINFILPLQYFITIRAHSPVLSRLTISIQPYKPTSPSGQL